MSTIQQLEELIEKRKGTATDRSKPVQRSINKKTVRIISDLDNFISKTGEFIYSDGKAVKANTSYHIHYTSDMKEYYMTGHEHNKLSRVIYPNSIKTDFQYYNSLTDDSDTTTIEPYYSTPTDKDYVKNFYYRFFAKQANDINSPPFEVSPEDYEKSSFYNFVRIKWYIAGSEKRVSIKNRSQLRIASLKLPNLHKAVYPLQHYRFDRNLNKTDSIRRRLGITDDPVSSNDYWETGGQQESGGSGDDQTSGGSGGGNGGGGGY